MGWTDHFFEHVKFIKGNKIMNVEDISMEQAQGAAITILLELTPEIMSHSAFQTTKQQESVGNVCGKAMRWFYNALEGEVSDNDALEVCVAITVSKVMPAIVANPIFDTTAHEAVGYMAGRAMKKFWKALKSL